jgi:uncharacterized protein YecE (DUF72 family)
VDRRAELRIGCSGWQYASWRGTFYPATLKTAGWFEFYAREFDTVEVNNTFYRLPERSVFDQWRKRSPDGFQFAIKGSRYLTHLKRLKAPSAPLDRLYRRAFALGDRLGPVLFQLPPQFRCDLDRLKVFLRAWTRVPPRLRGRAGGKYRRCVPRSSSVRPTGIAMMCSGYWQTPA